MRWDGPGVHVELWGGEPQQDRGPLLDPEWDHETAERAIVIRSGWPMRCLEGERWEVPALLESDVTPRAIAARWGFDGVVLLLDQR